MKKLALAVVGATSVVVLSGVAVQVHNNKVTKTEATKKEQVTQEATAFKTALSAKQTELLKVTAARDKACNLVKSTATANPKLRLVVPAECLQTTANPQ